jgi:hypothetical protein
MYRQTIFSKEYTITHTHTEPSREKQLPIDCLIFTAKNQNLGASSFWYALGFNPCDNFYAFFHNFTTYLMCR